MSGNVCRPTLDLTENGNKTYQFFKNRRGGKDKSFPTRSSAVYYMLNVEHLTNDDLRFMYWYDEQTEELHHLHTGEYVDGFREIEGKIYAYNFWMCENCNEIYRISAQPECPFCQAEFRFNVLLEEVPSQLLNREEREEIKLNYRWFNL